MEESHTVRKLVVYEVQRAELIFCLRPVIDKAVGPKFSSSLIRLTAYRLHGLAGPRPGQKIVFLETAFANSRPAPPATQ